MAGAGHAAEAKQRRHQGDNDEDKRIIDEISGHNDVSRGRTRRSVVNPCSTRARAFGFLARGCERALPPRADPSNRLRLDAEKPEGSDYSPASIAWSSWKAHFVVVRK